MPFLFIPTGEKLDCHRLRRLIDAGERVEISDEEAADLEASPVFRVEHAAPRRETVKRGGKRVEVTKAPAVETRGLTTGDWPPSAG